MGLLNARMLAAMIPNNAKPRRMSMTSNRSPGLVGVKSVGLMGIRSMAASNS
jgi:hypothetical protein